MTILTVWHDAASGAVRLVQLSDDPQDGGAQEQITYLAASEAYAGFQCVSANYTGSVPSTDDSLWRWLDNAIYAIVPVPQSVTPRQVRLLLLQQGLLAQVEAIIAAQDEATKITWQYASIFERDNPLLNDLAQTLVLSPTQLDDFFIAAAAL